MNETSPGNGPGDDAVARAARRLLRAAADRVPCAPVRDLIGSDDVKAAYAVQERLCAHRLDAGGRVTGRKIGLTSPAVQKQLGVNQPDFGVLFADMSVEDGASVPVDGLLQPKVEAEIAFVLGADLAEGPLDDAQVRAAVAHAVPALEIVDSRIAGWDITFGDTVADNGSSALYVLGAPARPLAGFEPVEAVMTLKRGEETVSAGDGAACLGDPLTALAWLARTAREVGDPLRAGQVVLSGALGPMVPAAAGDAFTADISGLGSVSVRFHTSSDEGASA
ncbi:2-keto-4-pentenoate hydratase [Streptomyces nitrosporeus]|uniref:4-oxalocrotonate decarboxylase n=1 Tax=Streptomyces nitrosporeus TaxID=28894 RepID=A0A5J6F5M2_9ACTN|nr:fumarylacetoacetate hydrolase family protein [Streptomyces nitrosporeus]QEU71598.1 4-oxalocrotonate decarboxylase [Streptomyces nitrosporeus]GGZ11662.1 putative hydratase/decarboxylase [Streptomyces nitrosporeus]